MNKIKIIKKKKEIYVHTKLLPVQQLNQREIEFLGRGQIGTLIPPYIEAGKKPELMYRVSSMQSLREHLHSVTSKKDFMKLILSILDMMKLAQENMLNNANFILHMDYIFINPRTKELMYVYLPITNSGREYDIIRLLMSLPYDTVFNHFEDCTYVSEYIAYFNNHPNFSIYDFEMFIREMNGEEVSVGDKEVTIAHPSKLLNKEAKICLKCNIRYSSKDNFCEKCGERLSFAEQSETSNVVSPQMQPASQMQAMPQMFATPQMQAAPQVQQPIPQMQATPQMQQPMPQMQATPQMQQPMPQMQAAAQVCPILQMQSRPPVSAGTTVLGVVDCGTTVLSPQELGNVVYPHIVRKSNGERIDVNSDSFTVGQSTSADYSVSGNTAISRNHAVIITKDGKYYIVDNSSTNGTYIDGTRIPSGKEIEIVSGQKLRFANEEYEFIV
jgi:hypothetical protein